MSDSPGANLLWWVIPGSLAGMPMPFVHPERRLNPGASLTTYDDELPELYASGIRAVVSLLNIPSDKTVYEPAGFSFICLPIADGSPPTLEQTLAFVRFVDEQLATQHPVAVHCEAGLGRTGTMLAAYLISRGATADDAVSHVRSVERSAIETSRQMEFLQVLSEHRQEIFPGTVAIK